MNAVLPKKPGPMKRGYAQTHILLPPDLLDWAKAQDGGLSDLVRTLLKKERARQQAQKQTGS
jgi:hypothetical protein